MGRIFNAMKGFFDRDDWKYTPLDNRPNVLRMGFQGDNGRWRCYAQARDEQDQFVFYSVLDVNCPENKRGEIAEFITRANYGMIVGNFEMDFSDGEIRYKTSVDVGKDQLTDEFAKPIVYINCMMMDKYLPGIMSVMYGGVTPADAITTIEG